MSSNDGTGRQAALIFRTPWGWMGIAETRKGLNAIVLPKRTQRAVVAALGGATPEPTGSPRLTEAKHQVLDYLTGRRGHFDVSVDLSGGTAFQRRVWRTLQRVPYGKLRSYQWVAARVGGRRYARAVGNAVGANPLPIIVPCHRIVAQDASLGGFSGGLPTKRKLLQLEGTLRYVKSNGRRHR
jgi:O-6-methylguanine DNA methyltransferase